MRAALHHALMVILQRRGLTLAAFARGLAWSGPRLHKRIAARYPTPETLAIVAAGLGMTADDLRGAVADEYRRAIAEGVELQGPPMVSERRVRPA